MSDEVVMDSADGSIKVPEGGCLIIEGGAFNHSLTILGVTIELVEGESLDDTKLRLAQALIDSVLTPEPDRVRIEGLGENLLGVVRGVRRVRGQRVGRRSADACL